MHTFPGGWTTVPSGIQLDVHLKHSATGSECVMAFISVDVGQEIRAYQMCVYRFSVAVRVNPISERIYIDMLTHMYTEMVIDASSSTQMLCVLVHRRGAHTHTHTHTHTHIQHTHTHTHT